MDVSLPPDLETFIHQKLESGHYGSAAEMIHEGLRLLKERDEGDRERLISLQVEVDRGIEQADAGRTVPLTSQLIEDIKARGMARLAARRGHAEA